MPRAVIVGGGIGGLTAAVALVRKGWDVAVFEAAPELRPVGKGIWVPTNAMQVLARLGLADAVADAGWPLDRIQLGTASGRILSDFDLERVRAKYGHTTISIQRAKLVAILAAELPAGVLRLGRRFTEFVREADRVIARFENGSDEKADLLVGADGLRSRVREQLFPGVPLRYSGQTCYRGVSELALSDDLAHTCREVWGGRNRFGFSAVGNGQIYWFAPIVEPAGGHESLEATKRRLVESYAEFPSPVPEIVGAASADDIIRTDLHDFAPIPKWYDRGVALLGDAAHAMTPNLGQGGAQAIEDAYVLAEQLGADVPVETGLANYQRIRWPKATRIVNTAWTFGQIAHWRNPLAKWARDTAVHWTPGRMNRRQLDSVYGLDY